MNIAGDLASFGETQRRSLADRLIERLNCREPNCILSLGFSSGSIKVDVVMTIPSATSANETVSEFERNAESVARDPTGLDVEVQSTRQVTRSERMVRIVISSPPPPPAEEVVERIEALLRGPVTQGTKSAAFSAAVNAVIVLVVFLVLGFAAACVVFNCRAHAAQKHSRLLHESPKNNALSRRRRPTVSEMRLQPDGTAGGMQFVVHQ